MGHRRKRHSYWLLVIGSWLLVIGYWLLVLGSWLLILRQIRRRHFCIPTILLGYGYRNAVSSVAIISLVQPELI
ncbi:hypothetical protein [Tychonema sp. LEGE 06208]|uniref:hypothetical protein n=1 Tax=Microcoleaceae TaxID=1892252 RepID=UPI00351C1682